MIDPTNESERKLTDNKTVEKQLSPQVLTTWITERMPAKPEAHARALIARDMQADLLTKPGSNATSIEDTLALGLISGSTKRLEKAMLTGNTGSNAVVIDEGSTRKIITHTRDAKLNKNIRVEIFKNGGTWIANEIELPDQEGEKERIRSQAWISPSGRSELTLSFPHIDDGDPDVHVDRRFPRATARTFNLLSGLCVPSQTSKILNYANTIKSKVLGLDKK